MFNIKNIIKIFIVKAMLLHVAFANDNIDNQVANPKTVKRVFYKKIDAHLIDPEHLKPEDNKDIQSHLNMSYVYNCDHDYNIKKNEYCGCNPDSNIPFKELKNYESLNNKEKLLYLKKDRENTLQKSLSKASRINMHDFTFTPFHVDILNTQ